MKKLFYFILCGCSFGNSLSVEQLYGDRIELLGIPFKDPLVLCQIFIALFLIIVFLQSSMDKIFDRKNLNSIQYNKGSKAMKAPRSVNRHKVCLKKYKSDIYNT